MNLNSPPPPLGEFWKNWGESLNNWLITSKDKLSNWISGDSAYQDGLIMWRRSDDKVIVSYDGAWHPLSEGGGTNQGSYAMFYDTTNQTATSVDTAYAITWDSTAYSNNISIDGTDSSKLNFAKSGTYHIVFSATIHSENASSKNIYFFPRIDGVDIDGSTMMHTLDNNNNRKVVTRGGMFQITAGSYIQAMWSTSDTDLDLHPLTGLSFAPDIPSATITIMEVTTS